jgi:hypothetical protein
MDLELCVIGVWFIKWSSQFMMCEKWLVGLPVRVNGEGNKGLRAGCLCALDALGSSRKRFK